jgi:hypothetical protein
MLVSVIHAWCPHLNCPTFVPRRLSSCPSGSLFLTGPGFEILPLKIYSMVRMGVKPEINALCTLMFSVTLLLVIVAQTLQKEDR